MNKIYLGNLPFSTSEPEVEEAFQQFGKIEDLVLIRDRYTKRLKGFGFVTFDSEEAANKAVEEMDGKDFMGRTIKVSIARERERRD